MAHIYYLQAIDCQWLDEVPEVDLAELFLPKGTASTPLDPGQWLYRASVEDVPVNFSYEDPGFSVGFEGELSEDTRFRVMREILANLERFTGRKGRIVREEFDEKALALWLKETNR